MSGAVQSLVQPGFSTDIGESITALRSHAGKKCLVIGNLRSYGDELLSVT